MISEYQLSWVAVWDNTLGIGCISLTPGQPLALATPYLNKKKPRLEADAQFGDLYVGVTVGCDQYETP